MKFSIRDLLLVTVIVALAVGWWVDHRVQVVDQQELQELETIKWRLEKLTERLYDDGYHVEWEDGRSYSITGRWPSDRPAAPTVEQTIDPNAGEEWAAQVEKLRIEQSPQPNSSIPAAIPPKQ